MNKLESLEARRLGSKGEERQTQRSRPKAVTGCSMLSPAGRVDGDKTLLFQHEAMGNGHENIAFYPITN